MLKKIQSYDIISRIGAGGMSIVYEAKHKFRDERVAIKSLNPQFLVNPDIRKRFLNEAEVLHSLKHKNIVNVLDFLEDDEGLYLILEFVEGLTLDKVIRNSKELLSLDKVIYLFKQTLDGIGYAHKKGVIHRDIKPSNILIAKDDIVKITDFGIAKIIGSTSITRTGTKMGTLYYMSPEQIKGTNVDEKSDIYSLCVTLYQMLTGQFPFKAPEDSSEFTIMNQIVNENAINPTVFAPHIPNWLQDLTLRGLEKEKAKRFSSVIDILSHLIEIEDLESKKKDFNAKTTLDYSSISNEIYKIENEKTEIEETVKPTKAEIQKDINQKKSTANNKNTKIKKKTKVDFAIFLFVLGFILLSATILWNTGETTTDSEQSEYSLRTSNERDIEKLDGYDNTMVSVGNKDTVLLSSLVLPNLNAKQIIEKYLVDKKYGTWKKISSGRMMDIGRLGYDLTKDMNNIEYNLPEGKTVTSESFNKIMKEVKAEKISLYKATIVEPIDK